MGFIGLTFIPLEFLIIFQCLPVTDAWSLTPTKKCININNLGIASTVVSCMTDLAMMAFVYPRICKSTTTTSQDVLTILVRLQMYLRQKAALLAVVSLGFLAITSAIVRQVLIQKISHVPDSTCIFSPPFPRPNHLQDLVDGFEASTWSAVEIATGFFCASAPCIRPLIRKFLPSLFSNAARSSSTRHATTIRNMGTQRSRALELSSHQGDSDYASMVIKKNTSWSVTSNNVDEFEDDGESRGSESAETTRPVIPPKVARKDTKNYYGSPV